MSAVIVIKTANGFIVQLHEPGRSQDLSQAHVATSIDSSCGRGPTVAEILHDMFFVNTAPARGGK